MAATNHLQITLVDTNQASPEVTVNTGTLRLEESTHKKLDVAMGDANQTLTDGQYNGYGVYKCTGALTGQRDLILPTRQKRSVVINATTGGFGVQVKTASGTGVVIATGDSATCYSDGTNVVAFSGASSGGAVTSVFGRTGAVVAEADDYAIADITGLEAELNKHGELVGIVTESGTSRTLGLTDKGKDIRCTSSSATTVTVPPNSSVAFPIGSVVTLTQAGTGQVSVAEGSGVTVNFAASLTATTAEQFAVVQIKKVATDEWDLFGHLEAA
jgi:hypothetical protein